MERKVYPGQFYRHFKNKYYQILAVATHSETGEKMVVYQALYGDFGVYVRPYDMFLSLVDREKYPDADQKYRFEEVEISEKSEEIFEENRTEWKKKEPEKLEKDREETTLPCEAFMAFLDADTYEKRMECIQEMMMTAGQREVDSLYLVLDMKPESGSIREQLQAIGRFLTLQNKYDGKRLR